VRRDVRGPNAVRTFLIATRHVLEAQRRLAAGAPAIVRLLNSMTVRTMTCAQCGAVAPDVNGPVHKYVPSAPGCWQVFGQVQADEALRFGYPSAHRIVVDAYMAQHPGDGSDRRDRQSVFVHLAGLCAVLEMQIEPDRATDVLRRVLQRHDDFPVLERGQGPGELTVLHLVNAPDLAGYEQRARAWGRAVWKAWDQHHSLLSHAVTNALR
jgi:hypothetical protein